MRFAAIHHIAIICSDYNISKKFYTEVLGFSDIHELYREERKSYKVDLQGPGGVQIELFSFPNPPMRISNPEATGLRHLAFGVDNLEEAMQSLQEKGILFEEIRIDPVTSKRFVFFQDPDGLPIELQEV